MRFKNNKVWLATDANGSPVEKDGKVLIKYQLEQDYEYWVKKAGVAPLDSPAQKISPVKIEKSQVKPAKKIKPSTSIDSLKDEVNADTICIYTDGASSGNPGPSGVGVVMRFGNHEKEISKFIGTATNNIAELKAIQTGLLAVKNTKYPVRVYTDSNYAYGVLSLGWKSKKNTEIVASIKKTMSKFKNLTFFKVKGHAGNKDNERADYLATSAIKDAGA
jgi:ribonuclease HI